MKKYVLNTKAIWVIRGHFLFLLLLIHFIFHEKSVYYLLFLNSILAYISIELCFISERVIKKSTMSVVLFLWLICFPNNFYLFTDLFHLSLLDPYDVNTALLKISPEVWIKLLVCILTIWPLTVLGCWSLTFMVTKIKIMYTIKLNTLFLYGTILLMTSIGVYLGRFQRLNSIDVFTNPLKIVNSLASIFQPDSILFIFLFFIFLTFLFSFYQSILLLSSQKNLNRK